MKATGAILAESRRELVFDEIEIPNELGFGQILVRMISAGVCRTQLREIDSPDGIDHYLPHLLGHEGFGIIEKIGDGVTLLNPGDHVVLHWRRGAGSLGANPNYRWRDRDLNAGKLAVFATQIITSECYATRVSEDVPHQLAPLLGCALTTGWGAVKNNLSPRATKTRCLIVGVGGLGLSALFAANSSEDTEVTVVDRNLENLEAAKVIGVFESIHVKSNQSLTESLSDATRKYDLIIDTTGDLRIQHDVLKVMSDGAKLLIVGMGASKSRLRISPNWLLTGKSIIGTNGGDSNPNEQIKEILDAHESGCIDLNLFPTKIQDFFDLNSAIASLRNGEAGRQVVSFSE